MGNKRDNTAGSKLLNWMWEHTSGNTAAQRAGLAQIPVKACLATFPTLL